MLNFLAETGTSAIDFSGIDFSTLVPTFVAAVGATIGVSVAMIAIKKGYAKMLSMLKKA